VVGPVGGPTNISGLPWPPPAGATGVQLLMGTAISELPERRSGALGQNCTPVRRDIYHVMTREACVVFKDPDRGQEKQALACLIFLRSRFL